jgi:DNA adenine methylase
MTSNSTAALVEKLYAHPGMKKHHVLASRSINSKGTARGKIRELLVTNYEVVPAQQA